MQAAASAAPNDGWASRTSAATPAATGADIEVPASVPYVLQVNAAKSPQCVNNVLHNPTSPALTPPGAATSTPVPKSEKLARVESSLVAATEMTFGSEELSPHGLGTPRAQLLPADTVQTTPR